MLRGRSDISITDRLFRLDDQTPLHDEIRMITSNVVVGRWVTDWSSEDSLKPYLDDFKRLLAIPSSKEKESAYEKLAHLLPVRGIRLPKELGLSFLGVEVDEEHNKSRLGLSYMLKKIG